MDKISRITTMQEDLSARIQDKQVKHLSTIREWTLNCFENGGVKAFLSTLKLSNSHLPYAAMIHTGNPFDSIDDVKCAQRPNVSLGSTGAMGCGGMLSPLLIVNSTADYEYMIYSKLPNGKECLVRSLIKDRVIEQEDVTESVLPEIKQCYGEEFFKGYNVGYFAKYVSKIRNNGASPFFTKNVTTDMIDFVPHVLKAGMKLEYNDDLIISKDSPLSRPQNDYKPDRDLIDNEQFDKMLMDKNGKYVFDIPDCDVKTKNGTVISFTAEMTVRLYPGIYKTGASSGKDEYWRFGLVDLSSDAGNSLRWVQRPSYNTFVFSDWSTDKKLGRISTDPHYVGNHLNKIAAILGLDFTDGKDNKFNDVSSFESFSETYKKLGVESARLYRNPFAKVEFRIKKIKSVKLKDSEITWSESDIRSDFGGLNEMFLTDDPTKMAKVLDACLGGFRKSVKKDDLQRLRDHVAKLWPVDSSGWAELPVNRETSLNILKFLTFSREHVRSIDPGQTMMGYLVYPDGKEVNRNWVFKNHKDLNNLVHIGDGKWALTVSRLKKQLPDGSFQECSREEFLATQMTQAFPHKKLDFVHLGDSFRLSTEVNLPKRYDKPFHTKGAGVGADLGDVIKKRSSDMIRPLQPIDKFLEWHAGILILNSDNPIIKVLFKRLPSQQHWQDNFYFEIQNLVSKCVCVVESLEIRGFSGPLHEKLIEDWSDAADGYYQYLINQLVKPLFESNRIANKVKEIQDLLDNRSVDSENSVNFTDEEPVAE